MYFSSLIILSICFSIEAMPTVVKMDLQVISGSEISLACDIKANTGSVILWKKDGRVLFAGDLRVRRNSRFNVMNDYLVIENANIEDTGEYVCDCERENGKLETFPRHLQVQNPLWVTYSLVPS